MNKHKQKRISQSLLRFLIPFLIALAVTTTVAWLNHYFFIAVFSLGFGILTWLLWGQRITQQIKDFQNSSELNSQKLSELKIQNNSQIIEIESYKKTIADLNQKLEEVKNQNNSQIIEIEFYKKTIADLRYKISQVERDCDKNLKNLHCQLEEVKNQNNSQIMVIETYKETIADVNQKLGEASSQMESFRKTADDLAVQLNKTKKQNIEPLQEILFALLPNIEFLRNSIDILCEDLQNPVRVIKQIKAIDVGTAVGRKIYATDKHWFEDRVEGNGDWRIYFKRDNQKSKLKIYIAHKRSQNRDFDWLKYQ